MSTVDIPADVRRRHGLPDGDLEVRSTWPMDDGRLGLWVSVVGDPGRVWPAACAVHPDTLAAWTGGPSQLTIEIQSPK